MLFWRFDTRRLATAFACWVVVYGHVPLLEALLGTDTCFNQRTGAALKWHVEDPTGQITLFDSPGFDPVSRVEKRPVTSGVCRAFAEQKNKQLPRRIKASLKDIEFFDRTGRPKVWYSKASDGSYSFYDRSGFDPVTSDPLKPVTKEIVAELMAADLARQRAEEAAAQQRAAAAAAEDARRQAAAKAEQQKAAEAQRRADQAMLQTTQPSSTPQCSGTVEHIKLTKVPYPVNPGGRCSFTFQAIKGTVLLSGPGYSEEWWPEKPAVGIRNKVTTVFAQAITPDAYIAYMLCPPESPVQGWSCR